jgi:hypothetical protein
VGLSVAAILLAVALVAGLLAWVRRDLRARGVSMRVWWLVLACYAFAAVAWLIAITVPLPVVLAWLATVPAAVATVIPERLAAVFGRGNDHGRRRTGRPRPLAFSVRPGRPMARPIGASHSTARLARPAPITSIGVLHRRPSGPTPALPVSPSEPTAGSTNDGLPGEPLALPAVITEPAAARPTSPARSTRPGRHRWHPGELRLAVEMLEDAARIPDLDEAARARIEVRLDRLDRFREAASADLLALVRDDVHARLDVDLPVVDPDPERARQIAWLLDELDPGAGPQTAG